MAKVVEVTTTDSTEVYGYLNGVPGGDTAGYDYAVTTAPGCSSASSDPFQLPRFLPWDRTRLGLGLRVLQGFRHGPAISVGNAA